jgi:two-component system chemotaxis response regulator CheY
MTILVVDDSRIMRNIIKNSLTQIPRFSNVDILEAGDGTEAWRILESKAIDLLLLDWNMPLLNGIELVKRMRKDDRFKALPIVMITSEAAKYNVIEAVKAGVNDYLVKPVSDRSLLEKIERLGL